MPALHLESEPGRPQVHNSCSERSLKVKTATAPRRYILLPPRPLDRSVELDTQTPWYQAPPQDAVRSSLTVVVWMLWVLSTSVCMNIRPLKRPWVRQVTAYLGKCIPSEFENGWENEEPSVDGPTSRGIADFTIERSSSVLLL